MLRNPDHWKKRNGKKTGVLDLTRGELGTRGTAELRDIEAAKAATIMGLDKEKTPAWQTDSSKTMRPASAC